MNPFAQGRGGGFVSNYNRGYAQQQQPQPQQPYYGGGYPANGGDGGAGYGQPNEGGQR